METNNSRNSNYSNHSNFQQTNDPNAWYEKTSVVVILCIIFFPVGLYALWKNSSISKGWKIGTTGIIALILFTCTGGSNNDSKTTASTEVQQESVAETEPVEATTNWQFEEEVDKMTSQKIQYASIEANEELQFDPPYEGGSVATLTIRKKDGVNNIYLSISEGQFNGTTEDEGQLRIKFDEKQPETFTFTEPSDGSSDTIFIGPEDSFIAQLKNSKKIIIETEFYDEGTRQIEFNVAGFKWE